MALDELKLPVCRRVKVIQKTLKEQLDLDQHNFSRVVNAVTTSDTELNWKRVR